MSAMRNDFESLPSQALEDYYNEDYAAAHEKYEWYFEHAEKLKPSLRGVRVSFCLSGWVDVAKVYPLAMKRILELKENAKNEFYKESSVEAFRDFACISGAIEMGSEVLDIFYSYHKTDKKVSKALFRHSYEFLIAQKDFEVCAEYMENFAEKYAICFECFDYTSKYVHDIDDEISEQLHQHRVELLKNNLVPIFRILATREDSNLYQTYLRKIRVDLEKRGLSELLTEL